MKAEIKGFIEAKLITVSTTLGQLVQEGDIRTTISAGFETVFNNFLAFSERGVYP